MHIHCKLYRNRWQQQRNERELSLVRRTIRFRNHRISAVWWWAAVDWSFRQNLKAETSKTTANRFVWSTNQFNEDTCWLSDYPIMIECLRWFRRRLPKLVRTEQTFIFSYTDAHTSRTSRERKSDGAKRKKTRGREGEDVCSNDCTIPFDLLLFFLLHRLALFGISA